MEDAIQSSVYVSSPEFAGWLTKRGFAWRKLWKKKWVALHGNEIVYMDKEPSVENASSLSITKAQITASTEISTDDLESNPAGFTIHINDGHSPAWYLRADSERQKKQWILRLSYIHAIMKWLGDFEKVRVLGVGGTGIVYELLHCTNGTRFAMKEMEIKNAHQMQMAVSEAEMLKDIMENVSHPNVMHIEKVFQVGSKFYLVFPLCTGGELYEHIIKRGHFTEHDAAVIVRDLISGLAALHARDILHLDIKPENILFNSNADDARIMITDFGLSRIYDQGEPDTPPAANARESTSPPRESRASRRFSMELMGQKMKAFLDNSELNIDRLKGTIGYMSPELILTGHCTKATDVFAAGVVLYILLSGRPPFNSRSNREVLEKTVKGAYKMSGIEWNDISDHAKDLVKKMLCTNPEQRITAEEILQHPWIKELDGVAPQVVAGSPPLTGLTSLAQSPSASKQGAVDAPVTSPVGKKLSNLTGALRALSGHVKHLQSEKLATSVTRLVSSMQNGSNAKGGKSSSTGGNTGSGNSLSNLYLIPVESAASSTANSPKDGASSSSEQGALSPKSAAAIEKAEDTRLRNDQDLMMLMNSDLKCALTEAIDHLALATNEDGSPNTSSTGHDNVGRLTIEQMMVILKHFEFIPASMSVNASNANKASIGALMFCRFLDRDGDGYISVDDISTAQALIMQRNEVFLKMIFRVYIESLWYPGRNLNVMNVIQTTPLRGNDSNGNLANSGTSGEASHGNSGAMSTPVKRSQTDNNLPVDKVEPPKIITGRHVAAVFEKLGYDPASGQKVFSLLFEAVARLKNNDTSEKLPKTPNSRFNNGSSSSATRAPGIAEEEDGSRGSSEEEISPNTTVTGASTPVAPTPSHQQKMDYADFAKAIEIDDVFLQVIFRKPRSKLISVVRRVSGSNFSSQAGAAKCAEDQDRTRAASSAVIENEFKEAFKNIKVQQSVFQKGMSAAFGLAAKFTSAAGALFETADAEEEQGDSDDEFHKHTLTG